jgi:beta-glucosidase
MTRNAFLRLAIASVFIFSAGCATHPAAKPTAKAAPKPGTERADLPFQRKGDSVEKRNAAFNERVKQGHADLIFIGDSITQGWEGAGKAVWDKYYGKRNAVNLGIGGDRTQHVLWRLNNGNLKGIKPKLAVIMIGTNNLGNSPEADIAKGIGGIVKTLRKKLPKTKILLLAIFPREEKPGELRAKLGRINQQIAKLDDGKHVFYLDIGPKFVQPDGSLSKDIMPDFLHLSEKGYEIWAQAIEPKVAELMGDKASR